MKWHRFKIFNFEFSLMDVVSTLTAAFAITIFILFAYWWIDDSFFPSTMVENERLVTPATIKPGGEIKVDFIERRYRTCSLQIGRYIRRVDRQPFLGTAEYQVQLVIKSFNASRGSIPDSYMIAVPAFVPPGDYEVFSRIRYFCDGLDYLRPRVLTTLPISFRVI